MKCAILVAAGLLSIFTVSSIEAADGAYPTRPIRFIVPFSPGGPSDILARLIGHKLTEALGQQVVPDNRGSAGGILGFELAAEAQPDGYTMLLAANSGLTINQHAYRKLPYHPDRDFQPVTQMTISGNVMVVHPSVPAKSVKEFIALAKSKPGKLNFASTGAVNLLGTELFKLKAGINIVSIPYKGTGQAVIDLVGGQVQMMLMNPLVAVPNIKGGKLRGLAVTSLKRNPVLPDLPTVAEAAIPGFENNTWHSVVFPAKTPKTIVKRMHDEIVRILHQEDVKERLLQQGLSPVGSTPEELNALIKAESKVYAKLVKDIGFQPM